MKRTHARTLGSVFEGRPVEWKDLEALLGAVGCRTLEGKGSRVKFVKDGVIASFHRPYPEKDAKRYQVKDAKEFLDKIGVEP